MLAKAIAKKLANNMGAGMEAQTKELGITLVAEGVVPALEGAYLLKALSVHKDEEVAE